MIIEIEFRYPYPVDAVLECIFERDFKNGVNFHGDSLNLSEMINLPHDAYSLEKTTINIRPLLLKPKDIYVSWYFNYKWDPTTKARDWKIELLDNPSFAKCYGKTVYEQFDDYSTQKATIHADLNLPLLYSFLEDQLLQRLVQQASDEFRENLNLLASKGVPIMHPDIPSNASAEQIIQFLGGPILKKEQKIEQRIGPRGAHIMDQWGFSVELTPFWIGTVATSIAAGFFIRKSTVIWIFPGIFIALIGALFGLAFISTSPERKNTLGFFLAIFSSCFWYGTRLAEHSKKELSQERE